MISGRPWTPPPDILERPFQDAIAALAQTMGWKVAHFRNSQTGNGRHVTAVAYEGKGFPDLVLAHPSGCVVFAEIKSAKGRVSPEQRDWFDILDGLIAHPNVYGVFVWRPADWPDIVDLLTFGKGTTQ